MTTSADSPIADLVHVIVARRKHDDGPLLPILHAVQEAVGYIPPEAVRIIASELNLTRAEVHGVVTFYHDFREEPGGRHVIKLCRAEACQSMGGELLVARAEQQLGIACGYGHTTADGHVTLEPVYCLGLCAVAPSGWVDDRPVGRLSAARIDALLKEVAS
jgi:formate dehydrogenase subunit gamma